MAARLRVLQSGNPECAREREMKEVEEEKEEKEGETEGRKKTRKEKVEERRAL